MSKGIKVLVLGTTDTCAICEQGVVWPDGNLSVSKTTVKAAVELAATKTSDRFPIIVIDGCGDHPGAVETVRRIRDVNQTIPVIAVARHSRLDELVQAGCNYQCLGESHLPSVIGAILELSHF